jgi:hypothetical protein
MMKMKDLQPVPGTIDAWPGYTTIAQTEQHDIGIHRAGTAAAIVCASALVTGAHMVAGQPTEFGFNIDASWQTTDTVQDRSITTKRIEDVTTSERKTGSGALQIVTESLSMNVVMPDSPNFDLNRDTEARRLIDPNSVNTYVATLQQKQAEGWVVTDVRVHGGSSDESSLTPKAELGEATGPNDPLAGQYGDFVAGELLKASDSQGAELPINPTVTGSEDILDKASVQKISDMAAESGMANERELIVAYKANPANVPAHVASYLHSVLDSKRGAVVSAQMERLAYDSTTLVTTTTRCVNETVIEVTNRDETTDWGGNLPLTLIPLPILGVRRRPDLRHPETPELPEEDTPEAKEADVPAVVPAATPNDAINAEYVPEPLPILPNGEGEPVEPLQPEDLEYVHPDWAKDVHVLRAERMSRFGRHRLAEEGFSYDWRRGVATGLGIALAGGAIAFVSSIRLDAGYCPDPENYKTQDWDTSKNGLGVFPDLVMARLEVPFTDFKTGDVMVSPGTYCPEPDNGVSVPQKPGTPNCDTRTVLYVDGRFADSEETHYDTAIRTEYTTKPTQK